MNNVSVTARNRGFDPFRYREGLPAGRVVHDPHAAPEGDPGGDLARRILEIREYLAASRPVRSELLPTLPGL